MGPRHRAVSTYLETMILIAVVLGTSTLVYGVAIQMAASTQEGAAVAISSATISQGTNVAAERVVIANTGTVALTSFTITTVGVSSSATYYLSLLLPSTGSVLSSGCGVGTNPLSVQVCVSLTPGQSVIATVIIDANVFTIGTLYSIFVSTSQGPQAAQQVVVTQA